MEDVAIVEMCALEPKIIHLVEEDDAKKEEKSKLLKMISSYTKSIPKGIPNSFIAELKYNPLKEIETQVARKSNIDIDESYFFNDDRDEELDIIYINAEEEVELKTRPPPIGDDMFVNTLSRDSTDDEEYGSNIEDSDLKMNHCSMDEEGVGVELHTHDPTLKDSAKEKFELQYEEMPTTRCTTHHTT
ncbi:hypothetical protein LXL04_033759 [Taraxacum kok-saghyz]